MRINVKTDNVAKAYEKLLGFLDRKIWKSTVECMITTTAFMVILKYHRKNYKLAYLDIQGEVRPFHVLTNK